MVPLSISPTKSSCRRGSLLLALPFLLFLSACDSSGPQASCEGGFPALEAGEFAVQVRSGGDCQLYRGEALFDGNVPDPDRDGRAFFAELTAEGGENAPRFFLSSPVVGLPSGTYEVSDLSEVTRFETREGKVSLGGVYVAGRNALSIGEGEVEVEASEEDRFVASFEATVKLKGSSETARLRGRSKADHNEQTAYTIFY